MDNSSKFIVCIQNEGGDKWYVNRIERKRKEPFMWLGLYKNRAHHFAKYDEAKNIAEKWINDNKENFCTFEIESVK